MNRFFKYILFLVGVVSISSCSDSYESPDSLSDVTWMTNHTPGFNMEFNVGEFVSFRDLSVNACSHEWEIQEGDYFLDNGFTSDENLESYINKEKGLVTTDKQINVYFGKSGLRSIRLHDTFNEKVTWNGTNPITSVYDEKTGKWVIDTCFVIKVFDEIRPAINVYKDAECTQLICSVAGTDEVSADDDANWETVSIEAGSSLYFVDMTADGEPSTRQWNLKGSKQATSTDSVATATFFKLGEYKGLSLTCKRDKPHPAANATKIVPLKIKVVPSSQPFNVAGTPSVTADGNISVGVTGEIDKLPSEAAGQFVVHAKNSNGFDADIPVTGVKKDANDATVMILTLGGKLYNTDEVTLTYNGPKNESDKIESVDSRELMAFDAVSVKAYFAASVFDAQSMGFDVKTTGNCGAKGWWSAAPTNWYRVDDPFHNGVGSMCYDVPMSETAKDLNVQFAGCAIPEAGTYRFSLWIYIEPTGNEGLTTLTVTYDAGNWTSWDFTTLNDVERGKWVKLVNPKLKTVDASCSGKVVIKVNKDACTKGDVKFYVDQFELVKLEPRP